MRKTIVAVLFLCIAVNMSVMGHAIRFDVTEHPPVVKVHAYFSATSPLINAKVEVFAPGTEEVYQTGRTDQAGFFVIVPVGPGEWVVTFDDERGHRGRTVINVTDDFFGDDPSETAAIAPPVEAPVKIANDIPLAYRVIFGLALIFGITGVYYGIKARKSNK